MLKVLFTFVVLFSAAFAAPYAAEDEIVQVAEVPHTIPQGDLMGETSSLGIGKGNYLSFKGIPYAEAPIGGLRFRSPRPHRGWSGVWDATKHGSSCLHSSPVSGYAGSEDCLFLNVYTPELTGSRAVMVWIHGGAFTLGSGDATMYGPEQLLREDVVVVSINYRLGFLGFFSTGDRHAQGNYALKDCVEALHWVQDNIGYFGGDRNRVTIFGESAGSVMVNYLVLSSAAGGLFHRAIGQSGTALVPWGFQHSPREVAFKIADRMGLQATTTEGIVSELRAITDLAEFTAITGGLMDIQVPRGQRPFDFSPNVETDWVEPPFLTEAPLDILRNGRWNNVPYIMGANSHESLFCVRELVIDPTLFDKYAQHPEYLIPPTWSSLPGTREGDEVINSLQTLYFGGQSVTEKSDYVDYASDTHFHFGTWKAVKMIAAVQSAPVYYYIFRFSGLLNMGKHFLLLDGYPGAMHADDLAYIFRLGGIPNPVIPGSSTDKVRTRMLQMWTDFAKTGNPTPEITTTITAKWESVGSNMEYMLIDSDLVPSTYPMQERMAVWDELDRKYGL